MIRHLLRLSAAAILGIVSAAVVAPTALAHEQHRQGDLEMVVGFGTEPAYAGQPNSVQIILVHDGEPVEDLGGTLRVEVSFGDESMALELEPMFGEPGDYRGWFIPTRPGQYEFHFTGTVDGEEVDETFTSGPNTFSDVNNPADIQFPVVDPSNGELAERIDRESARTAEAITQVRTELTASVGAADDVEQAADDAAGARTIGLIGIGVGALGLLAGIGALVLARGSSGRATAT